MLRNILALSVTCALTSLVRAQPAPVPAAVPAAVPPVAEPPPEPHEDKPWYEKLTVRGYAQVRFNRAYVTDDAFKNDLGDRALGPDNSFSIRRARLIVQGNPASFLAVYLQTDAAGSQVAMRDWYGDIFLDADKELRIRVGQSKVPYGWENMQSSQNRGPLDRSDAINSGAPGERDIGAFIYWAPARIRALFKRLVDDGLKGSGDYGALGFGIYSGQTLNVADKNDNRHVVARVTWPFELGCQILEVGAGGYLGKFGVTKDVDESAQTNFRDARAIASFVLYPQPIGVAGELTYGRGPRFDTASSTVQVDDLVGGYLLVNARLGGFIPFVRAAYYDGGLKTGTDAPALEVRELAVGTEWQLRKQLEQTAEIDIANRQVNGVGACDDGETDPGCIAAVARLQVQLNY